MTKGELKQRQLDLGLKIQSIALLVDDATFEKIKEPLKAIENGILELCEHITVEDDKTDSMEDKESEEE